MLQGKIGPTAFNSKHLPPLLLALLLQMRRFVRIVKDVDWIMREGEGRITRIKQNADRLFPPKLESKHLSTHLSLQLFTRQGII
jgi:hypothetical protein